MERVKEGMKCGNQNNQPTRLKNKNKNNEKKHIYKDESRNRIRESESFGWRDLNMTEISNIKRQRRVLPLYLSWKVSQSK